MLLSLGIIFLGGIIFSYICNFIKIPKVIGMILWGIIIGPSFLDLISDNVLFISGDLRKIALIIILARAGLTLNIKDLLKNGRPAILMCFIPAIFEILSCLIFAPKLLGFSINDSLLLGSILAAVSPAIVVPRMINLINKGYGTNKYIPQMIMAGASMDDVFVLILFSIFLSFGSSGEGNLLKIFMVPVNIILSIVIGIILGGILHFLFRKIIKGKYIYLIILISIGFLLVGIEDVISWLPFSGILSVMVMGMVIRGSGKELREDISKGLNFMWGFFEILLFVLVGVAIQIDYMTINIFTPLLLIILMLIFRGAGIILCLIKGGFNLREKIFIMVSYMPKATVQATIGAIPLTIGLPSGEIILLSSVIGINFTSFLFSTIMDASYKVLLSKESQ